MAVKSKGDIEIRLKYFDGLSDVDAAYIAGLLDGEGCFTMQWSDRKRDSALSPRIVLCMCSERAVEWFSKTIGNSYREKTSPSLNKNGIHKQYRCNISGSRASSLAKRIIPYLKVKRRQAELFVRFAKTLSFGINNKSKPGTRLSAETITARHRLKEELMRINGEERGRVKNGRI